MPRKLLMVLLGVGAVAGYGAGFARLCYGHGPFGHLRGSGHGELQRRVADACTESALRVYGRKTDSGATP